MPLLYEIPLVLEEEGLAKVVCRKLNLNCPAPDLADWQKMIQTLKGLNKSVTIALVGKYVALHDAYLSVVESLKHGGISNNTAVCIKWIESDTITKENVAEVLSDVDGVLVPGGFGPRGIDGKIIACEYARKNLIPYFGICLGMQIAIIEFARNILGHADAHSTEHDPCTSHPVIDLMPDQKQVEQLGGTMRLGQYPCKLKPGTKAHELYGTDLIFERHRHRYEVNNDYRAALEANGVVLCGTSPDEHIVEMLEIKDHPWFIAVQFHPEFKSRPNRAHPLFAGFIKAALEKQSTK